MREIQLRSHRARRVFLAFAGCILAAPLSHAGMIIAVQSVADPPGSNGDTLQVTLTNTGGSAVTVAGFSFGLSVATANLIFTAVDDSTVNSYVFANHSLFGPDISVQPPNLPGQTLEALDSYDTPNAGATVAAGATVGLGKVTFNISSNAPFGPIAVSLIPAADSLSDQNGAGIAFTGSSGTVLVVPEPGLGALVGLALLAMARRFAGQLRRA